MSQTDPGTLMERLRDGFRRLTENRMNLILICAVTGIILIAASYIWDEQAEPAESVSDAGTLLSADTRTLEQRLSEMVSRIDGAGRSCVMVTMEYNSHNWTQSPSHRLPDLQEPHNIAGSDGRS